MSAQTFVTLKYLFRLFLQGKFGGTPIYSKGDNCLKNSDLIVMKSGVFFSKMSAQTFVYFVCFQRKTKCLLKSAIYM